MLLTVKRFEYGSTYCIGKLYIDGEFHCYTLEDKVREDKTKDVWEWKVAGETAIPSGTYKILIDWSNRFQRRLPHLMEVPGFTGVRIHSGNTDKDTEGCLLVGKTWNGGDFVYQSREALTDLLGQMTLAQSPIVLQVGDSLEEFSSDVCETPIAHV